MRKKMEYVYAKLDAICQNVETEDEKMLSVVMRFDNKEECEMVADHLFDSAIGCFNEGLPDNWVADESPEIDTFVSAEEAVKQGYVIYRDS